MLREASVYVLKRLSHEEQVAYGLRVLTMRKWPRGVCRGDIDLWMPSAAPSLELLTAHHMGSIAWEEFLALYQREQQNQRACRVVTYTGGQPRQEHFPHGSPDHLKLLEGQYDTVTILCWENGPPCHRYTLVKLLQERSAQDEGASSDST